MIPDQQQNQHQNDIVAFSEKIEKLVRDKGVSYIDAVVDYCDESGFEIEVAATLVSETLKYKIQMEAESLHFLPKSNTAKLPI